MAPITSFSAAQLQLSPQLPQGWRDAEAGKPCKLWNPAPKQTLKLRFSSHCYSLVSVASQSCCCCCCQQQASLKDNKLRQHAKVLSRLFVNMPVINEANQDAIHMHATQPLLKSISQQDGSHAPEAAAELPPDICKAADLFGQRHSSRQ